MELGPSIANRLFSTALHIQPSEPIEAVAYQILNHAQTAPELATLLDEAGYDMNRVEEGLSLFSISHEAHLAHTAAIEELEKTSDRFEAAEMAARQHYHKFRSAARRLFSDAASRLALGVEGAEPEDLQRFEIIARSGYDASNTPPFRDLLTDDICLEEAYASLDNLVAADDAREFARTAVLRTTKRWNQANIRLYQWASRFCKSFQPLLQTHPEYRPRIEA